MKITKPGLLLVISLSVSLLVSPIASSESDRVELDWKRDPNAAPPRGEVSAPAAPELPSEMTVAPAANTPPTSATPERRPATSPDDIESLAARAGENAAIEAARERGWRQYWRAGFVRGVATALDDPRLGAWDREEGRRYGRRDLRAGVLGAGLANEVAKDTADRDAQVRVRDQFMDLGREPRRDRTDTNAPPPIATAREMSGPWAVLPVLEQVFETYPFSKAPRLSREGRRALEDWNINPSLFARNDRGTSPYDARWKDPAIAYDNWRDRQRPGSPWSRFTSVQREQFRQVFFDQFLATLGSLDLRPTYAGWRIGFDDGWRYGAAVQAEWAYRQGYAEGFDIGVRESAVLAFPFAYSHAFSSAYDAHFDDWSRHPHPDVLRVRLSDESDDGVFEPGERVFVDSEVVNYGGGAGTFQLSASGRELDGPVQTSIKFSGRGRAAAEQPFVLRIDDRVKPRTDLSVTVAIGDAHIDTPFFVSRPLAIDGEPTVEADRLAGRVTLTFAVTNTSRRDASATLRVEPQSGSRAIQSDELGVIAAGRSRQSTMTFEGIRPLALISGQARWTATIARGETLDDVREIGIAPVVADLRNSDLMDFMLALAQGPRASRNDVQEARALMLERLRADWSRAAAADGNPYKRDYESESTETALGALVRATNGRLRSFSSPQVFDGLDSEVSALTEDLPGAHPLLRKWMKKLAKRVG